MWHETTCVCVEQGWENLCDAGTIDTRGSCASRKMVRNGYSQLAPFEHAIHAFWEGESTSEKWSVGHCGDRRSAKLAAEIGILANWSIASLGYQSLGKRRTSRSGRFNGTSITDSDTYAKTCGPRAYFVGFGVDRNGFISQRQAIAMRTAEELLSQCAWMSMTSRKGVRYSILRSNASALAFILCQ